MTNRAQSRSVVDKGLLRVVHRHAALLAEEFVVGCLVGILEPAPSADVVDKNRLERRRSVRRDSRQQLLEGLSTANRNAASSGIFIAVRADKPMS